MVYYKQAIGLDVGGHSAKAVRAVRRGRRVSFEETGWVRLPSDFGQRQRVLRTFVKKNGWEGLPCVVQLRGESVMLRRIDIAPEDPRSVEDIIAMETDQFNGLTDQGTASNHVAMRGIAGHRSIFMAVGRNDVIQRAVEMPGELALEIADVVPGAVAMFNAVSMLCPRSTRPFVCVELGHDGTEVVVGQRRSILSVRRFPIGMRSIPESLRSPASSGAKASGLPMTEASVLKAADNWIHELQSCLRLYVSQFPGDSFDPEKIILCGGGARVPGISEKVEQTVGIKTLRLSDLRKTPVVRDIERFATAMGLAMAGIGKGYIRVSLLPHAVREKLILQSQKKYWVMSSVALVLATLIMILGIYTELKRKKAIVSVLKEELSGRRMLKEKLDEYRRLNNNLEGRVAPFRKAVHNGEILRAVIQAAAQAKHPDDWITLIADADSYFQAEQNADMEFWTNFGQIVIEGYTPVEDLSTVRAMIEALRKTPAVLEADLLGDDRVRADETRDEIWATTQCRLFAVEMTVAAP